MNINDVYLLTMTSYIHVYESHNIEDKTPLAEMHA